jgi:hypothetical protein
MGRDVTSERWYGEARTDAERAAYIAERLRGRPGFVLGPLLQLRTTDSEGLYLMGNLDEPDYAETTLAELRALHGDKNVVPIGAPTRTIAAERGFHKDAALDLLTLYMVPRSAAG